MPTFHSDDDRLEARLQLNDALEELAGYDGDPEDWVAGEVAAKGALAIALALREVADAINATALRDPEYDPTFYGEEPPAA